MSLEKVISTIYLDVYDHDTTPTTIKTIALDNIVRVIHAYLQKEGAIYQPDPAAVVELIALRSDGVASMCQGSVILLDSEENGQGVYGVSAEILSPMIAVEGIVLFQFRITYGNEVLRTEIFKSDNGRALDQTEEWADNYNGYNISEMMEKLEFLVRSYEDQLDPDIREAMLSTHLYLDRKISVHDNALYIDDPDYTPFAGEEWVEPYFREIVESTSNTWLEEHPEARVLIEDGTLSEAKLDEALKRKLAKDYVTPQMFGATGEDDGESDAIAIQAALDASLNVYFPAGTYLIDRTLNIRSGAHIFGDVSGSRIRPLHTENRLSFTGEYLAQLAPMANGLPVMSTIKIEHMIIDCDGMPVKGLFLARPYNNCTIRDTIFRKCLRTGLSVGVTTLGDNLGDTRSQTLVIDNCLFEGTDDTTTPQTVPLAYFYNCYEFNLKDTKFLYKNGNKPIGPCVEIDQCYDFYIRGCSFANSFGEAIKIERNCRYFRMMANTYENIAYRTPAYIISGATPLSTGWLSGSSGSDTALTPSKNALYQLKNTSGSYTAGRLFRFNGEIYVDASEEDYPDYLINMDGYTSGNVGGPILAGMLFETTYYNANRNLRLNNTKYIMAVGTFRGVTGDQNEHTTLYNILDGGGVLLTDEAFHYKEYTNVTTESSQIVSPWGAYVGLDISADVTAYGKPVTASVIPSGSGVTTNPAMAMIVGDSNVGVYSASSATFKVRVTFRKD